MRDTRTLSGLVSLVFLLAFQAGEAQGLREAVTLALDSNPETTAADFAFEAAAADMESARAVLFPRVTFTGSAGAAMRERDDASLSSSGDWLHARELRVSIIQQLHDGGKDRARVSAARENALAAEMMLRKADDSVALGVVEAYLGVLRARALTEVALQNVAAHREALTKAEKQAELGGDRTDRTLVSGRLGLAQSVVASREALLKAAEVRFLRYVGVAPSDLSPFTIPPNFPNSADEIDTSQAPDYLIESHFAAAAAHEIKAVRAAWAPEISAEARGGVGENVSGIAGADNEAAFFITLGWNFFDSARKPAISAAIARARQAEETAENAKEIANEAAARAWTEVTLSRRQRIVLQRHATKIREVRSDFTEQFGLGKRSLLNLLDIRNEQFRADSALVDVQFQEKLAAFRLLAAMGTLAEGIVGSGGKEVMAHEMVAEAATLSETDPEKLPAVRVVKLKSREVPASGLFSQKSNSGRIRLFSELFKPRVDEPNL